MRKLGSALCFVVFVTVMSAGQAGSVVPPHYGQASCSTEAQGVRFQKLYRTNPDVVASVGRIAPGSPVRIAVVSNQDRIVHDDESLEKPSAQCTRVGCILGLNADFENLSTGEPLGGVVTEGRMMRSPDAARPQLTVSRSGGLRAGPLDWTGSLRTSDAARIALSAVNRPVGSDQVVLFTRDWGPRTDTPSGTVELTLSTPAAFPMVDQSATVRILGKHGSDTAVPAGGAVLAGRGTGAARLQSLWNKVQATTVSATATVRLDSLLDPMESVGGHPHLLSKGSYAFTPNQGGSFITSHHPRTMVGWNSTGEVIMAVIDGRTDGSDGMTMAEAADLMLRLGATDAMNFDGGGGSTFVVDGKVASNPADDRGERGVVNTLQVVAEARPATPVPARASGYWMIGEDGTVFRFGDAGHHGDAKPYLQGRRAVDLEPTPSGNGYYILDTAGKVFGFGDAAHRGNVDPADLDSGERISSLSATPSGAGYWVFTSRGRTLPFGDARFFGDMSGVALNGPVLDSIPTPSGRGYYMVASDGGIFAFGDAAFRGSMGSARLNSPVQSLVPDPDGDGYWLVASDGGVFAFAAPFRGSMGSVALNRPVTGMVAFGNGYLMVGEDGGMFNFSDKPFHGSLGSCPAASAVISLGALG